MKTLTTPSPAPLVVIPTFNEAPEVLNQTVAGVLALGYRVLVIDDGSDVPVLEGFQHNRLMVVRHSTNLGQGAALQTAIMLAVFREEEVIVTFDADGQHDVGDIQRILLPLQNGQADVVLGSRFLNTKSPSTIPLRRRVLLRMGVVFNMMLCGLWMSDAHNGLRALNRRAMQQINLGENRMAHATELIWQIRQSNLRWQEVPVNIAYTAYSMQKDNVWWRALRILRDILTRRLLPDKQPVPGATVLLWLVLLFVLGLPFRASGEVLVGVELLLIGLSVAGLRSYRKKRQKLIDTTINVRLATLQQVEAPLNQRS